MAQNDVFPAVKKQDKMSREMLKSPSCFFYIARTPIFCACFMRYKVNENENKTQNCN